MQMMRTLQWAALIGLLATPVSAGDWVLTGMTERMLQAVDRSNIRSTGNLHTYWTVSAYNGRQDEGQDYTLYQERIDCSAQTIQTLSWTDRRFDEPAYSESRNRPEAAIPIVPESVGWSKFLLLCRNELVFEDMEPFDSSAEFAEAANLYISEGVEAQ